MDFIIVVWPKIEPTFKPKNLENFIIKFSFKKETVR